MRRIETTKAFKRDYQKVKATPKYKDIETLLRPILALLVEDAGLPARCFDHPLVGEWKDHRDCHVKPDLVLIYRKVGADILQLVRLGSHSQLGL